MTFSYRATTTEQELRDLFGQHGTVVALKFLP